VEEGDIATMTLFLEPRLFEEFALPLQWPRNAAPESSSAAHRPA
jgi:hypothetical protein